MTRIFAHRGASGYAPENTLISFKKALEMNVDGIELDVQLSKDGFVVVCHDETVDRTTDHKGYIKDYTLKELKSFNANNHMQEYSFECIPTLDEVLELLSDKNVVLNIEFKTSIFTYKGIVKKVIDLVDKYNMQDRVIYSSFNHLTIKEILELEPNIYCGLLDCDWIINYGTYAKDVGAKALHPCAYLLMDEEMFNEMKSSNLDINVFTINKKEEMIFCYKSNISGIFTNYPDLAVKTRDEFSNTLY